MGIFSKVLYKPFVQAYNCTMTDFCLNTAVKNADASST